MIARTWHGRTRTSDAEVYRQYVTETGIRDLTSTKGNRGAQVWQQPEGDITHIWVISWWENQEVIRAFSGDDVSIARYYPEDKKYLLELEPQVQHYEAWDYQGS